MRILKLGAILGVLICGLLGVMMVLGLIQDTEALETLKKALIVIAIITACLGAVSLIASKPK